MEGWPIPHDGTDCEVEWEGLGKRTGWDQPTPERSMHIGLAEDRQVVARSRGIRHSTVNRWQDSLRSQRKEEESQRGLARPERAWSPAHRRRSSMTTVIGNCSRRLKRQPRATPEMSRPCGLS